MAVEKKRIIHYHSSSSSWQTKKQYTGSKKYKNPFVMTKRPVARWGNNRRD
jgi:hypothetical protein